MALPNARPTGTARIAADVGGTFTDIAIFDERTGSIRLGKALTTPDHLVDGINDGVAKSLATFAEANLFLHGTTVAINTLLERTGARTALVTTKGFRDIYEIGRVNRPEAYNLYFKKHKPLVERALRFEVNERMMSSGEVRFALHEEELERVAKLLDEERIEALAILFLHSYRNPSHEIAAKQFFEKRLPGVYITASHELSQEYREFERTSTVAANAYIGPRVRTYLGEIVTHLKTQQFGGSFLIVQSTGGLYDADRAQAECIRMLESGPAAGVIATQSLCREVGWPKAIAFDMGGTTAKSGVILEGEVLMTSSSMIGGYAEGLPVQIPMIDIQEVGTGGGSIARLGPARSLRVGPQSAGASPGPVCYTLGGTEPTVTDANLVLGRLNANRFLGGDMKLDLEAAREALRTKIAEPLGLSIERAADGIIRIAAASMSNVVKRVTTERGLDARDFPMVAFGGAGPLHAVLVARDLQIGKVIIPNAPGHFSAYGMLVADLRRDYVKTLFTPLANLDFDKLETQFVAMETEGERDVLAASNSIGAVVVSRGLDMRYVGQEHAVTVDIPVAAFKAKDMAEVKRRFDAVHTVRYGYCSEKELAEIVSIRTSVAGAMPKPALSKIATGSAAPPAEASNGIRKVYFSAAGGWVDTHTFQREHLRAGNVIIGPALIEEYASTTVMLPGDKLSVDALGNLSIEVANG
ncbi:MAG: hydantoinase/oxoprolinase family protein [Betaproteobacteria bacterium]|nr:hydantoinase/oxoprolinase family protein [Betaproteobacteria bacterium]